MGRKLAPFGCSPGHRNNVPEGGGSAGTTIEVWSRTI
jgi:hypothetical protein